MLDGISQSLVNMASEVGKAAMGEVCPMRKWGRCGIIGTWRNARRSGPRIPFSLRPVDRAAGKW